MVGVLQNLASVTGDGFVDHQPGDQHIAAVHGCVTVRPIVAVLPPGVAAEYQDLLFDPQTSGGLLVAIAPDATEQALAALQRHGVSARQVGRVFAKRTPLLAVK